MENSTTDINSNASSMDLTSSKIDIDSLPPPPPPSNKGIFGGFINLIKQSVPVLIGILISYIIGYFDLNIIYIVVIFLVIWRFHLTNFNKGFTHYKDIHISEKDNTKYSAKAKDSSEWLNLLIAAVFPNIAGMLDSFTKSFMNSYLNNLIKTLQPLDPTKPKPAFIIDSITVKKVSFGVIAPTIDYIKSLTEKREKELKKDGKKKGLIKNIASNVNPLNLISKKNKDQKSSEITENPENVDNVESEQKIIENHFKMDTTLKYAGDISLELVVKVGTSNLKLKLPVVVENMNLTAEMYIGIVFQKGESWFPAKSMEIGFRQLPENWLKFDLKAFQSMNLFDIYGVEQYLLSTVDSSIKNMMLLPEMLKVDLSSRASVIKKVKKKSKVKQKGERSTGIIKDNILDRNSSYRGCMIVEIRQIKGLKQTDPISLTDAYCKVSLGRYEYTTPIVSGSLDPRFTVLFDFPIESKKDTTMVDDERDERVLIECFDNEKIGEHTKHGSFWYDITEWTPEKTVSGWFHFTKPVHSPDGQIDLSFTYYPDLK